MTLTIPWIDVVVRGRLAVAFHDVRLSRGVCPWNAPWEQALHESAHVEPDLRPERFVVRLEDRELRPPIEALLQEQGQAPHLDVFPF